MTSQLQLQFPTLLSRPQRNRRQPDRFGFDSFIESHYSIPSAYTAEFGVLEPGGTWDEVPVSEAQGRIIPGTWTFKRKRTPDGTIFRHKARYCLRGDLMEKTEDTFAPVVAFATVRLFTVLVLTLGWESTTIDYTNAFTQAPLHSPCWIRLPLGFGSTASGATCLKLKKTLYGSTIAPKAFYLHISGILQALGFKQSVYDPCLLFWSCTVTI